MTATNDRAREREWALKGASARLIEIGQEREAILRSFPELRRAGSREAAVAAGVRRKRPKLTAEAKRKLSAGMRKYWAKRKAAASRT
jgi:hypothetical protein